MENLRTENVLRGIADHHCVSEAGLEWLSKLDLNCIAERLVIEWEGE